MMFGDRFSFLQFGLSKNVGPIVLKPQKLFSLPKSEQLGGWTAQILEVKDDVTILEPQGDQARVKNIQDC